VSILSVRCNTDEYMWKTCISRISGSIKPSLSLSSLSSPPTAPEVVLHEKRAELGLTTMTMFLMSCEGVDRKEKNIIDETRDVQAGDVVLSYRLIKRSREGGKERVGECCRAGCCYYLFFSTN